MKLDWLKDNLLSALAGVALLAGIGYGAWGWLKASGGNAELRSAIAAQQQRVDELTRVKKHDVFPSPQNVAILRQDRYEMEALYGRLDAVAAKPVTVPPLTPVQFASRQAQTLRRLQASASNATVVIPARYTFGFTHLGVLAPTNEVAGLTKRLIVTEALCANLFACGISRLDTLESETASTSTNSLYSRLPITLKFTCDTKSLQKFINNLQTMNWLFSIRSLTIQATPVSPLPSAAPGGGAMPGGFPGAPPGMVGLGGYPAMPLPPPPPGQRGANRAARGREGTAADATAVAPPKPVPVEIPGNILTVTMHLDLLEFAKPAAKSTRAN